MLIKSGNCDHTIGCHCTMPRREGTKRDGRGESSGPFAITARHGPFHGLPPPFGQHSMTASGLAPLVSPPATSATPAKPLAGAFSGSPMTSPRQSHRRTPGKRGTSPLEILHRGNAATKLRIRRTMSYSSASPIPLSQRRPTSRSPCSPAWQAPPAQVKGAAGGHTPPQPVPNR